MTSIVTDLIRQYRARANEARDKASAAEDEDSRQKWLQLADTWERMAAFEEHTNQDRQERHWSRDQFSSSKPEPTV